MAKKKLPELTEEVEVGLERIVALSDQERTLGDALYVIAALPNLLSTIRHLRERVRELEREKEEPADG